MVTLDPPGQLARAPQAALRPDEHRLTAAPLARPDHVSPPLGWQPPLHAAPVKVEVTEPPLSRSASAQGQRVPVSKLLFTKSATAVQLAVQDMRALLHNFPDADDLNIASGRSVSTSYNAQDPNTRSQLWTEWHIFSTLCRALGVPVFPIQPDKVALVLSTYANLPISPVLRELARLQSSHHPGEIPKVLDALNVAAKATRHLWPDVACFVRSADSYDATAALSAHVHEQHAPMHRPVDSFYSRPPAIPAHLQRPPHPPSRDSFTSRPLLTHVPPAPPLPAFITPPPDQFIQPAHGEAKQTDLSLRSLCEDLPGLLNDMQKEKDDLAIFELAQDRFQTTVNTPEYASRVARLHHTAVIYTHVTALLRFPTYPITSRKLAVFALAMTPGALGAALDAAAPGMQRERQCPRAPRGKTLEDILQDLTVVRSITRGDLSGEEKAEWTRWWKEITDDWKGKGKGKAKAKTRRDDEQHAQPASKRIKRSATPESDGSVASTSRLPGKKARQPRSRISATEPSSRAGSPAVRGKPGKKAGAAATAGRTRAPSPLVVYPRFVPERKGVLPADRREPPLPPIMDSPWFVPKKKKVRGASVEGSADGSAAGAGAGAEGEGGSAEESSDDEDEQAKVLGRSVALHRPRRGGTDMRAFDISLLWD
ncbi:hypothetical protein JCM10450v2_007125 [Rhodotorula kratochvilovae]